MSNKFSRISSVSYEAIAMEAAELEIEPEVYRNATGTAEKAPYLLRITPKGSLDLDAFCAAVAAKTGHTFEETRRENDIRMEVLAQIAAEGYTYIDTGYIIFELRIAGSISSTTDAPTREANAVYIAAYPSRDLAAAIATIKAKLSKDSAAFSINTVWGENSHDRFVTSDSLFQVNTLNIDSEIKPVVEFAFARGHRAEAEVTSWKANYIRAKAPFGVNEKTVTLAVTSKGETITKEKVPFKYVPYPMTEGVKVKVKVGGEGEDTVGIYGGALAEGSTLATIDWGDGYVEEVTSLSQLSHKYELPGEYTLRISDDVSEIAFSSPIASSPFASEYAKRILEVEGVGEKLTTLRASALMNAANLVNAKFASVDNVLTDVLKGANAIHYIHFAAANETALKASAGYQADARLGSTSARVKFDL
ncbi:MAG: hypothetical protein MJ109_06985 [Kiritimatiellae bacterium]|nr:hypothetical protein [Kiritimatiellia bacterium]